jgi:hypothetical protein
VIIFLMSWVGTLSLYASSQNLEAAGMELVSNSPSNNSQEELRLAACRNGEPGNCMNSGDELVRQKYRSNAYAIVEVLAATVQYKLAVTMTDIAKNQTAEAVCYDILVMQKAAQKLCNYFLGPEDAASGGCGDPAYAQAIKVGSGIPKQPPFKNFLDDEEEGLDNRVRAINEKTKELTNSIYCKTGNKMRMDKAGVKDALGIIAESVGDVASHATDTLKSITSRDMLRAVNR